MSCLGGAQGRTGQCQVGRQGDDGHRLREVWTEVRRTAQGMRTGGGLQVPAPGLAGCSPPGPVPPPSMQHLGPCWGDRDSDTPPTLAPIRRWGGSGKQFTDGLGSFIPDLLLLPPFCSLFLFVSLSLRLSVSCLCVTLTLRGCQHPTPFSVLFAESPVILSLHPVSQPYYLLSLPPHLPCLPPIPHLIARLSWSIPPSPPCSLGVKINRGPGPWNVSRKCREKISNLSSLLLGVPVSGVRMKMHLQRQSQRTGGRVPQTCCGALLLSLACPVLWFSPSCGNGHDWGLERLEFSQACGEAARQGPATGHGHQSIQLSYGEVSTLQTCPLTFCWGLGRGSWRKPRIPRLFLWVRAGV